MCKYKIVLNNITKNHEYEEMIKIFLRPDEFVIANEGSGDFQFTFNGDKNVTKKEIYLALSQLTGKRPLWGIVTGIRPVKMTGELIERLGSVEAAEKKLREYYLISEEKIDLVLSMYAYQMKTFGKSKDNLVGLYIGIPFCPTRCLYCSFASNQVGREEISRYVEALHEEVRFAGDLLRRRGLEVESVYIGGGTPTTLSAEQLDGLLCAINEEFGGKQRKEFTLEAGRPDTITKEKLMVAKKRGVDRISINPQSMNDDTLMRIGRDHDSQAIREAFSLAEGFIVNADVIAGLPGETLEDFRHTLREVAKLSPENITVHSLSVKRASRLVDVDKDFHYKQGDLVEEMLAYSKKFMAEEGYQPYYLYRQKQMSGAQENIGYCKPGSEGLYNIRIMDEHQTIIALGAGGVSKAYYPEENRLERIPNLTNYELYIERLDEMKKRKEENIPAREETKC